MASRESTLLTQVEYASESSGVGTQVTQVEYSSEISGVGAHVVQVEYEPLTVSEADTKTWEVHSHVTPEQQPRPLTGVFSPDWDISGWVWDRRLLEDLEDDATRHLTYAGGHNHGLTDGTYLGLWRSATPSGCGLKGIKHYDVRGHKSWTPWVETGEYTLFWEHHKLFSDLSHTEVMDPADISNGVMTMSLRADAVVSSVEIALYRRDDKLRSFKHWDFNYVSEFTGEMDTATNTRKDPGDPIDWNILETRKQEFIVDSQTVYLNDDYRITKGELTTSVLLSGHTKETAEAGMLEYCGNGRETGRFIYTEFFPLDSGSVELYHLDPDGTLVQYTEVDSIKSSGPGDKHFEVDYSLGIIKTGGWKAPDLVLAQDIGAGDTTIETVLEPRIMKQYPDQGVITIGSEEIQYSRRTTTKFLECSRGYNSTTAASHSTGDVVKDRQHGEGTPYPMYVGYTAVPRVDYEVVADSKARSCNGGSWLDINPVYAVETNNILQVGALVNAIDSIELETDSPLVGANLYGPLYYGSDTSRLTARVLGPLGNPVDNIDTVIEVVSGEAYLNGSPVDHRGNTNTRGEIHTFMTSPLNQDNIRREITDVTHDGADTTIEVSNLDKNTVVDDIWIFQVFKHDPNHGSVGIKLDITNTGSATEPWGAHYLEVDGLVDEELFRGGKARMLGTDSVVYTENISYIETLEDGSGIVYSKIYLEEADSIGSGVVTTGQTVRVLEENATTWDQGALNGVPVILYEWDAGVEHPDDSEGTGAYMPIHPDAVESDGDIIRFSGRNLPEPDPVDDDNLVGAYLVIAPEIVTLRAYARDPISGETIYSNTIRISVELLPYLTGVDTSVAPVVPTGWTLPVEEFNVGAGLGGANFITVNPMTEGINQFSIMGTM